MPSGILGQAALSAATDTTVYTVPSDTLATVNVNFCNRGSTEARVRLALCATGSPSNSEYIEYDWPIPPNGTLERTGFMLQAGKRVVARADSANVSVTVQGPERAV